MPPRRPYALAALALSACASRPLPAPPPPEPPRALTLEPERFRRGEAPPSPGLDPEQPSGRVRAAILAHRTDIQECFERVLPASPDAAGRVTLSFTAETNGVLTDVDGETDVPAFRLTRECVLALVRPLRIEGLSHAFSVRYPLEFENQPVRLAVPPFTITPRGRYEGPDSAALAVQAGRGELSVPEVRASLLARLSPIQGCYTTLLRTARRAEGQMFFELAFAADGSLTDLPVAQVPDALLPARDCVRAILRDLRLRDTRRRASVTCTLVFQPREPAPAQR